MYKRQVLLSNASSSASLASQNIPGEHYWLDAINGNTDVFLPIGPGDFMVHHAIALGLHTTTLILVKGALDARGSKLMPDKKDFGYSFPPATAQAVAVPATSLPGTPSIWLSSGL